MKNWKKKLSSLVSLAVITISSLVVPVTAVAESINGTVTWDSSHVRKATGTKNGKRFETEIAPLKVNGETAFCLEPGIPINNNGEPGYVGNPANGNLPRRAMLAMALWDDVFGSTNYKYVLLTQSVVWMNLEGANKAEIDHIEGFTASEIKEGQDKLNAAITNYDKKPSFAGKNYKLTLNKPLEIKNTNEGVDLKSFDTLVTNSAGLDVKVDSDKLTVTAKDLNQKNGRIAFKKSIKEGTPYIYKKEGQQTVSTGRIDDPNNYTLNFDIETTGNIKIVKIDKESGATVPNTKFHVEYSGTNAPKAHDIVTGSDGSYDIKDITHDVKVKATETEVPAPYVLASAIGESDTVEGTVKVGETITLTQKNTKAKGQIIVEKQGVETGQNMWNENYTLKGNVFEIRKKTVDGEVIKTITTDEKGYAETPKDLELGTYWVTEKQASNGFANTFKPVEVKIEYANQTTAVVVKGTEGTNQEVVGSSTLTKQDTETGSETQGKATFKGAEYSLFHKSGEPVKWNEAFKPELTVGDKANEENIVIRINEQSLQAGVKHLALGDYYWQETKAPEGYQIDNKKHEFTLSYKDQNTKVVTVDKISNENVIKFNIDGFKYVTSMNGSAQSGYNGIKFNLTPIDPTKGDIRESVTETNEHGYDGYWNFKEVPYGDYTLTEVEAPEGFKLIKPLTINSSFDEGNREYKFTITEEGQNHPIKVLVVPEEKINEGSNIISLSKLFLYDDSIEEEEPPTIETLFLTSDGEREFDPTKDQELIDYVTQTNPESDIGKEVFYVTQFHKVFVDENENLVTDKDGNIVHEVVGEIESIHEPKTTEDEFDVRFDYKANTLKDNERLVATHVAYKDKEHKEEYATHFDLENEKQTLIAKVPEQEEPEIETLFLTSDGEREFDPTKDQELIDYVTQTNPESDIGKEVFYVTQFHKVFVDENENLVTDKDGNIVHEVVGEIESIHEPKTTEDEFDVRFDYKANTLKDNERLVATHVAYKDKEYKEEYATHFDLENEKQTLIAKVPEQEEEQENTAESNSETPKEKETKSPEELKETKSLPKTGESIVQGFTIVGITGLVLIGVIYYLKKRKGSI